MTTLKLPARLPINGIACVMKPLVSRMVLGYLERVTVNPVTGRRNPRISRRNSAQTTTAGVFFRPRYRVMAAVCGQASAWSGAYYPDIPTPHTAATQSRRKDGGSSQSKVGAAPMIRTQNPSALKARAAAHRAMALAALSSDSSLASRVKRYNRHVMIARDLEALEVSHGTR